MSKLGFIRWVLIGCVSFFFAGVGHAEGLSPYVQELTAWAELGDAEAQNNLANCYDLGHGVPQDDKQAVKWYTKAAEQGHAGAQRGLANCYRHGRGVLQDYKQAANWFTKAAEQGVAEAQNNLALYTGVSDTGALGYIALFVEYADPIMLVAQVHSNDSFHVLVSFMLSTGERITFARRRSAFSFYLT
jgi:TPR repeat protein